MKLMVTWQLHPGKMQETLARFSALNARQERALAGKSVKLLGRWHDLVRGKGVAIYETDDATAFTRYAMEWNKSMDLDISVVLDDEETRALGKA